MSFSLITLHNVVISFFFFLEQTGKLRGKCAWLQEELQRLASELAQCSSPRGHPPARLEAPLPMRVRHMKRPVRPCRIRKEPSSASDDKFKTGSALLLACFSTLR